MDKLLKLLSRNSEYSVAELALMLGEPEDYVRARIKSTRMTELLRAIAPLLTTRK